MQYILLVDKNSSIQNLEATALKYFYGGKIITASNAEETIHALKSEGLPEVLVVDLEVLKEDEASLYKYLEQNKNIFPIVASAENPDIKKLISEFPVISAVLEKPITVDSFISMMKGLIRGPTVSPSHVPIDINTIMDLASNNFDLFLMLSGTNFVKIISKDDVFLYLDAQKLMAKGIKELYILASDTHELLNAWEKNLKFNTMGEGPISATKIVFAIEAIESVEKIARAMNWSKEVITSSQKTINSAIQVFSKDPILNVALRRRLANRNSPYSIHVGLLSLFTSAFCLQLGWTGESGQLKLVMASLLHDIAVEDSYYKNIREWNTKAANLKDKSDETVMYRMHAIKAAALVQSLEIIPSDVDNIILQHHEKIDGTGFPRSLTSSRIGHLATLFIMVEDLLEFIGDGEHLDTSLKDYITWGQAYYDQGNFKKVFEKIKDQIIPN